MAGLKNYWILLLLLLLFLPLFIRFLPCNAIDAYKADFPSANISASWKNNPSNEKGSVQFFDGSTLRPILLVYNKSYPPFGLGFFSNTTSTSISSTTTSTANNFPFYLVVFMLTALRPADEFMIEDYYAPRVFWSANRDKPVRENATLDFTIDGDLVLKDADGSPVWSTSNTSGHSATRMEIIVGGNLMLLNASNGVVWQSFDYPTDTWLPNQKIYYGQRLTARNSSSNLSTGYHYSKLKNTNGVDEEDDDDQVTEALTKFSFEELKSSTHNFQIKLGQGGFGSVFEGVLCDGTKVAVKCLESIGQGRKEFLAEVNTIGKVDHFNLVRLIGYCVDKSNRLLVYEHMCNGSLDRWIFNQDTDKRLDWKIRRRIIYGVAKGLEYLHEECSRNIIHFDIKPQNILLDGDFHAKISDFGLAKLIDRNQSVVLTALKGTPGYVAPELFGGSNISVKADVYSFGIVILETVCGRKNLDSSEAMPLINVVRAKAEGDQLYDLIDEFNEDIRCHKEETIKMIKIGIWCLQTHDKRPSMSMVVKALEGLTNMDIISDYQFLSMSHIDNLILVDPNISGPPEASILSGPR